MFSFCCLPVPCAVSVFQGPPSPSLWSLNLILKYFKLVLLLVFCSPSYRPSQPEAPKKAGDFPELCSCIRTRLLGLPGVFISPKASASGLMLMFTALVDFGLKGSPRVSATHRLFHLTNVLFLDDAKLLKVHLQFTLEFFKSLISS